MDRVRIIINSCPRSAHAWLQTVLIDSTGSKPEIKHDDIADSFITRANTPAMLLGKFDNAIQTTILRDPITIIPSIVTKTMGGLGTTVTAGIPMPHEYSDKLQLENLITHQFTVYKRWVDGLLENIDNLMPFTFEQVTQDIEFCVVSILDNFDIEYYAYSNDELPTMIAKLSDRIRVHDKGDPGYNNPLPVEKKPDIYYKAVEIVNNHKLIKNATEIYENALEKIYKRQENYG